MAPSTGFEEGVAGVQSSAATGSTGQSSGGVTCPTGHPGAANDLATDQASHELSTNVNATCMHAAQGMDEGGESSSDAADVNPACTRAEGEEEALLGALDAPPLGEVVHTGVHYYVDVPNSDDIAYPPGNRNVEIDPGFHEHLQEECEVADISTFLALPEIIPTRQHRRPQPLLDFTKSKILTSRTYTE